MARPRKAAASKRSATVVLYLTPAEKRQLESLARQAGLPVATFARLRALGVQAPSR
jgi:hypothetical protein